ncbi:hypothetical protein [Noviherbaspirillum malthae]|uniref:hypothetical protein n=1 Tax=Noviherbaspirillum malthae TaxID=1260987 RepID=UPI00188DE7BE|nr:hypothetical protein [Noviherbaspirillum malthae]
MKIITPSDVVAIVLERKTRDFRLRLYENTCQKVFFIGSIASLISGVIAGILFRYYQLEWLGWLSLISISGASISALAYQVAQLVPEVIKLKNPEREVSSPLAEAFNDDMDLIHQLSISFEVHHLNYAKVMYITMARQIRERIGLLVGALDKIGVIPVAVTTYLSYAKVINEGMVFGPYQWIGISFVCLYLLAIRMTATAQWMEHVAELYAHAQTMRSSRAVSLPS